MFYLKSGIHLHEIKGIVGVEQKLHGAGAAIADGPRRGHRGLAHLGAHDGRQAGCRRFLDHLLVAALQRAVALEQIHRAAVAVAEHLDLDVARPGQVFLHQHGVVAKGVPGLAPRGGQGLGEFSGTRHHAHALAAAAGGGLEQHRVAHGVGGLFQRRFILVFAVVAGYQGHAGAFHQALGGGFRAHGRDRRGRRADEHDAGRGAGAGEGSVFRQKPVAGMDCLGAGLARGGDDLLGAQIGIARRRRADGHRLVGHGHVQCVAVGLGIDRDRVDAQAPGGADHPTGDLAAVGNQDLVEHGGRSPVAAAGFTCGTRRSAIPRWGG